MLNMFLSDITKLRHAFKYVATNLNFNIGSTVILSRASYSKMLSYLFLGAE